MSFRSTYTPRPTGSWISADEKAEMIREATPFLITRISEREDTYQGNKRTQFVLTVRISDAPDEDRLVAFDQDSVYSRDDFLVQYAKYLDDGGTPTEADAVVITKAGAAQLLEFAVAE